MAPPVQNQYAYYGSNDTDANPHWVLSVLSLLAFFPLGALSLVFSILCTNATTAGNHELAQKYSLYAKRSSVAFIVLAVLAFVAFIALLFIGIGSITVVNNSLNGLNGDNTVSAVAEADASYYAAASSVSSSSVPVNYAVGGDGVTPSPNYTSAVAGATLGLEKVTYTYSTGSVVICGPKLSSGPSPVLGTTC
jgi:hypothetical protein